MVNGHGFFRNPPTFRTRAGYITSRGYANPPDSAPGPAGGPLWAHPQGARNAPYAGRSGRDPFPLLVPGVMRESGDGSDPSPISCTRASGRFRCVSGGVPRGEAQPSPEEHARAHRPPTDTMPRTPPASSSSTSCAGGGDGNPVSTAPPRTSPPPDSGTVRGSRVHPADSR